MNARFLFIVGMALGISAATGAPPVIEEKGGLLEFEAEDFFKQEHDGVRKWHVTRDGEVPEIDPDGDPPHLEGASGGAYLEVLPDTRRSHDDKLIKGENFTEEAGSMAVLSYKVKFGTPGTYWIWARVYSTTTEDNGLHFGINGEWPETARRWQTTVKDRWHWESLQRTKKVHVGEPGILTLDVDKPGEHVIQVAMREDGIELDKILLVNRKDYRPDKPAAKPVARQPDGDGSVEISGEKKQWHKVTLTLDGPFADERDTDPNPFTDRSMWVRFRHESGEVEHLVPGYFAADGNAAESSAGSGTKWRAHLSPDRPGSWTYTIDFRGGKHAAFRSPDMPLAGEEFPELAPWHGKTGSFEVGATDKQAPDFRARGRLQEVAGERYLRFAGDGSRFLKAGADSPETLLAFADFDATEALKPKKSPLKHYKPHVRDWSEGDPTWKGGKGKGLIGALNYLSGKGMNAFSFIPYNAGGDGDNVWPFVSRDEKLHYDCSKLDQWGIVFDHAVSRGLFLHFKLQETENDDRKGPGAARSLDGGELGPERMLYLREMVARFGHELALNWNLGEENTQTNAQQKAMAAYLRAIDSYGHPVVLHTYPDQQDKVYGAMLGKGSPISGLSVQNSNVKDCHWQVVKWVRRSAEAGRPWLVAFDEPGDATWGMPPDEDWPGMKKLRQGEAKKAPTVDEVRRYTLWGTLLAGGWGVEYYFGYKFPENDLYCEDWRSRDSSWDYARIALEFFAERGIPFWEMECMDERVGNPKHDNSRYCFGKQGGPWLVYLPTGGSVEPDFGEGGWKVEWFNPRNGSTRDGGAFSGKLEAPDKEDWLAWVR